MPSSFPPSFDAPSRFEPLEELGSGGGGAVWLVRDRLTNQHLALKVILGEGTQRQADALVREVVALSGLEGLGLPRVVRFGRLPQSGRVYMLREVVDGESLDRVLEKDLLASIVTLAEAADQLTVLHRAGLLHGDLKPANIIARRGGGTTLVDLGLVTPWLEQGVVPEGLTPRYAAPELLQGRPVTVRAEIFSLGLVLEEILGQPQSPELAVELMTQLRRVADTATNFDPALRHPSADEFASELRSILGLPPTDVRPSPILSWPILGIDATSARLLTAVGELGSGKALALLGPEGSGRSVLLRRLAWSLGISGVPLAYVDDASARNAEAALAELALEVVDERTVCLVDDADQLAEQVRSRLHEIMQRGGRLVLVGCQSLELSARIFAVPSLSADTVLELVRRVVPSLTDQMVSRIGQHTEGRPAPLRELVERVARGAVASLDDLERLIEDASPTSEVGGAPLDVAGVAELLDRGRYRDVDLALAHLDAHAKASPEAQLLRARLLLGLGEAKQALAWLLEHPELRGAAAPGQLRDAASVCLARARVGVGDYRGALEALEALPSNDSPVAIEGTIQRGLALWYLGEAETARELLQDICDRAATTGQTRLAGVGTVALGLVAQREDRLEDAHRLYEEAVELGRAVGDAGLLVTTQLNLAGLRKIRGDLAGAIESFERALDLGYRTGRDSTVYSALLNLANVDLYLGRLVRARSRLDEVVARADQLSPRLKAQLAGNRAELMARSAEIPTSLALYEECARAYEQMGRHVDAAEAWLEGILVMVRDPSTPPATPICWLDRARSQLQDAPAHRPLLHVAEGRIAMLRGEEAAARTALDRAVELARDTAQKEWLWRALEARSELETRIGRRMRSRRDREEALSVLEEIGAELPRDLREVYWNDPRRGAIRASIVEPHGPPPSQHLPGLGGIDPKREETNADVSTLLSTPLEMRLARILEINAELVGELDLDRLTGRITEHAMRLVKAERGLVLLDHDGALQVQCTRGIEESDTHRQFSSTIAETVLRTGEPIVSVNARDDARMESWGSVHELMVQSVACVPIRAGQKRVIGALYLETRLCRGTQFSTELPMLQAFADQVAIAIHNAQLLNENQRRTIELRETNQKLRDAHARLEELLGNRTAQLERTRKRLRETRETLLGHFGYHGLVGTSGAMRRVYSIVERIRDTDVPVLITGESGTGKEMVARALHVASPRGKRRFVGVNCGAIPENLLESELFGCVRGAFTGADRDRKGLFRESEGGTILLDEIGEMPKKMQAGLLRVLQEHKVRPVGGTTEEHVDVRLVFATHRDLTKLVEEGAFREDLYYRIRVVDLAIPPLRERREDIPQLVDHFLGIFAARYRRDKKTVSREALRLLMAQPWRGNVRELEHVLLNAWVLTDEDELDVDDFDLGSNARPSPRPPETLTPASSGVGSHERAPKFVSKRTASGQDERQRIVDALAACSQNRVRAAQLLGMPRRTFYRRLKEFAID